MTELGWGIEGVVYRSPREPAAVKVHTRQEGFLHELAVYKRLSKYRVTEFQGFAVPRLLRHSEPLQVIELSVVKAPCLLDFGAAKLDSPEGFTEDAMSDWWHRTREDFGDDFERARDVYFGLIKQYGIYYYDLKPRNLQLR